MKNCVKTSRGVIIVTMSKDEAAKLIGVTDLTIKKLVSHKDIYRMWIPKNYTGEF